MEKIIEQITASKKYKSICPDTIRRIAAEELPKYKSEKDTLKAIKTRLHCISGSFTCSGGTHISGNERQSFESELFGDIFMFAEKHDSILDIACGLNPLRVPQVYTSYYATEIDGELVSSVNAYFKHNELNGKAELCDILCKIPQGSYDLAFLFKLLPLLEQQKKGYAKTLLNTINAQYIAVTFPTKSLTGKSKGMQQFYSDFMLNLLPSLKPTLIFQKIYPNEQLFILQNT